MFFKTFFIMANPPPSQQPGESPSRKIHYRLTFDEWCASAKRLKPAEIKVLYYLHTLDPFGDRWLDIEATVIAEDLGIHKSSVSRALQSLARQGKL